MLIYGLKNCDKCRAVLKQLTQQRQDYIFKDVRVDGVEEKMLIKWVKKCGWKALLNTRSTTWRSLELLQKQNIDESKAIALMAAHPTLIRRPVIIEKDNIKIGSL